MHTDGFDDPSGVDQLDATVRQSLQQRVAELEAEVQRLSSPFPPGHFYSPIPDLSEIRARDGEIFRVPPDLPGIDLRAREQLDLLPALVAATRDVPFGDQPTVELRYGYDNPFFGYGDGLVLYGMLRHRRPRRYVEVGSGWSSALVLDVRDRQVGQVPSRPDAHPMSCTFIEPHPERLRELMRSGDESTTEVVVRPLQDALGVLLELQAGDILFIDSTHVAKVGSDVVTLFRYVLPSLPSGVHVHFHDIFYPFEYPRDWVYQGRAWNENYLLHAFLAHNPRIRITWFNSYLYQFYRDVVADALPLWARNPGGSIWLETQ